MHTVHEQMHVDLSDHAWAFRPAPQIGIEAVSDRCPRHVLIRHERSVPATVARNAVRCGAHEVFCEELVAILC
jgi:hypothetical protein